ncbi:MAG: hypothetical protein GY858_03870, partial [Candidatus Omnitrophica bacterium]|nr:hypothetical protein [Candidatus Omnitrophota bacterium]
VGYVSDPFDVTLTSNAGSIIGLDTEGVNVQTLDLTMDAAVAIVGESDTSFTTDADTIYAYASELIDIYDIGSVTFSEVINSGGDKSIFLTSQDDMYVGYVSDPFDVTLTSNAGAIIDNNGDALNIATENLSLSAVNGIASSDDLDTAVSTINAVNALSGDINIENTGDLYVQLVQNFAPNANISVTTHSNLMVGSIIAEDAVYLNATDGDIVDDGPGGYISAGTVSLNALGDIGDLTTLHGDIDLIADVVSANAGGSIAIEELDGALFENISGAEAIAILTHGSSALNDIAGQDFVSIRTSLGDLTVLGDGITSFDGGIGLTADYGSVYAQGSGPHLVGGNDSFINAPFGRISPFGAPLNVSIKGDLILNISNLDITAPDRRTYGNLAGTVEGGIPLLYPTSFPSPLNPPGFVYFNGVQIWPPTSSEMYQQLSRAVSARFQRGYLEFLQNYRMVSFDQMMPTFYAYHPLTSTDSSAFDDIALDEEFYEFLEGSIEPRGPLAPYFEGT